MAVAENMEACIREALAPEHLEVIDESHRHNVPPGAQSHFKLVIVSERFEGEPLIARHRRVNGLLASFVEGQVHALSLETLTGAEWAARGGNKRASPPCLGGGKGQRSER